MSVNSENLLLNVKLRSCNCWTCELQLPNWCDLMFAICLFLSSVEFVGHVLWRASSVSRCSTFLLNLSVWNDQQWSAWRTPICYWYMTVWFTLIHFIWTVGFVAVLNNLAASYDKSGNVYEAINLYQQALDIKRHVLPHNDISIGDCEKTCHVICGFVFSNIKIVISNVKFGHLLARCWWLQWCLCCSGTITTDYESMAARWSSQHGTWWETEDEIPSYCDPLLHVISRVCAC